MNSFSQEDIRRMSQSLLLPPHVPVRRLIIGKPWVEIEENYATQYCVVTIGDIEREIYFRLQKEFAGYLCFERGDAYLIGLLNWAMRERCDIYSEVPLTRELVHQIKTELIPALVKYAPRLYAPKVFAELADLPLPSAGKVGTGCSCGIDSLYAIKTLTDKEHSEYLLDYLTINNVGAYGFSGTTSEKRRAENEKNAREFCEKYGYKLIITNSNFADAFPQEHLKTHLYSSGFAIHMLSKLWGRYYYASTGCDMEKYFRLSDNELSACARYDLIALPAFSTSQLRICNQAAPVVRFEKTKSIANYEPAKCCLNVCLTQGQGHCGKCSKCLRTLWTLDALGKLDEFHRVFDIEEYRKNRKRYLRRFYLSHINEEEYHMIDEAWDILKSDIRLFDCFVARASSIMRTVRKFFYRGGVFIKRKIGLY